MKLLERDQLLDRLGDLFAESEHGRGRLVLVAGEAGIGKTALVEAFREYRTEGAPVLWGSCDAVAPARPFAPLADIADEGHPPLRQALEAADRARIFEGFLAVLRQPRQHPLLVVFEDLHWADDATLDLLRVVGRRLRSLSILVIGTYRDDEVTGGHPLRLALGDLPADVVTEIRVPALSIGAVEALAEGTDLDVGTLHRVTAGNPFYVTELAAAGGKDVPVAVSDAVLARAARLSMSGQHLLRVASVLGERCELALACELADVDSAVLEECLARGMLEADGGVLRFRHELAQRAVREALAPSTRVDLHAGALAALRRKGADPARLAHHAVEAGDADAVLELAPVAAAQAASLGAHREAVAHYAAALRLAPGVDERSRAELLERHGRECLVVDEVESALVSQQEALESWRRLGDGGREASCLSALSLTVWVAGDGDSAIELAERAVELLESISAQGSELAQAYATLAQRHLSRGEDDGVALAWAERALELARRVGDELAAVHALTTAGVAEVYLGKESGWSKLDESVRQARAAGLKEEVSRALINIVEAARDKRRYDLADRYRDEAIAYISEQDPEHDLFRRRLLGVLAEIALERCRWDEAERLADGLVSEKRSASLIKVKALTVLGRLGARRGYPDPWSMLDEALALAAPRREAQDLCPLYAARAEAAWLDGNAARTRREAESGLALALEATPDPWWRGELGFWTWKAGRRGHLPADSAEPYVLHAAGRHHEAASLWESIGCPYQQAFALGEAPDEESLRSALEILYSLSAHPLARHVVRRLQAMGARNVPRGPRAGTRSNPAGLTARELDVLALLAEGLRNADIAERLVVSAKTVDHHVSAILRKLAVPNRAAAAEAAARLRLKDGETVTAK